MGTSCTFAECLVFMGGIGYEILPHDHLHSTSSIARGTPSIVIRCTIGTRLTTAPYTYIIIIATTITRLAISCTHASLAIPSATWTAVRRFWVYTRGTITSWRNGWYVCCRGYRREIWNRRSYTRIRWNTTILVHHLPLLILVVGFRQSEKKFIARVKAQYNTYQSNHTVYFHNPIHD